MIRFAYENDVRLIRELWDIAFPEESDFNSYFFENIFDHRNTLINIRDNELLAMAQMMPYEIKNIGKVTYIYGAATNLKYRKQGLMSELLKKTFEIDKEKDVKASMLIPANRPLFDFYGKLGYETAFYCHREILKKGSRAERAREAGYEDIPLLMDIYRGDVIRNFDYWKVQLDMYKALGGKIFIYKNAYAVVSDKIEEIMYSSKEEKECLADFVCDYIKSDSVEVTEMGEDQPLGMIKKHMEFDTDKMYMNLMFN